MSALLTALAYPPVLAAEVLTAEALRRAPSRGILSTDAEDADGGATATGAAEALASRMAPLDPSVEFVNPPTTPSKAIVASHAPRAPNAVTAGSSEGGVTGVILFQVRSFSGARKEGQELLK
jgi:hypothetical protein